MEDQSVEEQHALPIIFQPTNIQLQSQCVTIIASIHADTNKKSSILTGWPKKWHHFLYALKIISSNVNRFSKLFHCQNQEKICNNTITKDPTTPQVCRYTTL